MEKWQSSTKVWLFLVGSSLALMLVGYHFGGRLGLLIGFCLTLLFHWIMFWYGQSHLLQHFQARRIKGQDAWGLQNILRKQSLLLQEPAPELYVAEEPAPFAFSICRLWDKPCLGLSTGLLEKMTPQELEAVVAQLLCQLQSHKHFSHQVIQVIGFSILGLGGVLDRLYDLVRRNPTSPSTRMSRLFAPLAWMVFKTTATHKNFFKNDGQASQLVKEPRFLAEAIWKLQGLAGAHPLSLPPCQGHFFIVSPAGKPQENWLFATHPDVESRIKKLIGFYPL